MSLPISDDKQDRRIHPAAPPRYQRAESTSVMSDNSDPLIDGPHVKGKQYADRHTMRAHCVANHRVPFVSDPTTFEVAGKALRTKAKMGKDGIINVTL